MSLLKSTSARVAFAFLFLTLGFGSAASAATSQFKILLNLDNQMNSGCDVPTLTGTFPGVEQILVTTVNTTSTSAQVTALELQSCINPVTDTFGPLSPVAPPPGNPLPWPVGTSNGTGGTSVIETFYPLSLSPVANPPVIRLGVLGLSGGLLVDELVKAQPTPGNGPPILLNAASVIEVPTLSEWGLIFLGLLLAAAAVALLRRRTAAAILIALLLLGGAGVAWAAACDLNGTTLGEWSAANLLASETTSDAPAGADIRAFFGFKDTMLNALCFRIDALLLFNQPPTAVADAATVNEDAPATPINVLVNDTDPDPGDPLIIQSVTQPANGTVVITGGGTGLTYTPNANYCNTPPGTTLDTFTYTLAPGTPATTTATVSVAVTCVDDNPTAVNDAATVPEDSAATAINVLANDTDPDGGAISITSVTQPANGTVVITGGGTGLTYMPNAGYCNTPPGTLDTFTYTLTPGGSTATVSVTVTCTDDSPTAVNDAATVAEDSGPNAIDVLANDTDPDAGPKSVASVTQPANGTVVITGGGTGLTYQPNANYCNSVSGTPDTFTYTLTPGGSTATVSVTVTCADDPPVAVADAATVAEDSGATAIAVLANDTDPDAGPISIASVTQPANGTVVITGGGTGLTYAPNADYCNSVSGTPDTFTYTLTPGGSTATVSVTVTCVDDNPVAVADAATVAEDSGANAIDVLANDTDIDAGPKSVASVTQPANGTVVITGGGTGLTYQPNANYCNTPPGTTPDTFTYTLTPGGSTATVSVMVTCGDDAPTAVNDAATVTEDSGSNTINVQANDIDLDGGTNTITAVQNPSVQGGTVLITNGGLDLTYTPAANYCNTPPGTTLDTFTYTLTPGGSTATVTVTVTCVDDPPVLDLDANDDKLTGGSDFAITFTEGDPATLIEDPVDATVTDVDSANLASLTVTITNLLDIGSETLSADVTGTSITANYVPATGVLTLTGPDTVANFQTVLRKVRYQNTDVDPDTTPRVINFVANDGTSNSNTATTTVTVVATDTAPTAVNDSATVAEDSGANAIDVLANDTDPDNGPKSIASVTQPANGTVVITGGGTGLTYAPNANYCNSVSGTPDTFTYTLTPGGSTATVSVTVTCGDDNPVAVADAATVVEDSGANAIDVLANDTDADGGPKSIASVTQPANGTVVITGGGTGLTYAPNANYCNSVSGTPDTFTYTLTPGGSSTTVSVTVTCVDDNPVAVADAATVVEDSGANSIDVLANDTDIDGGPKSIASVTQPANGTVVITGGGTGLTYAPNANYCNSVSGPADTFTYTLTPGGSTTTVSVTVTCVDDNPAAVADAATVTEDSGANAIDVLANDTDPDGGPKSVASVTQPANGTVVITGGGTGLTYAPNANYCNTPPGTTLETFMYTLTPGGSTTTVTVTVTCVDDNPAAVADAATVTEDSGANAIDVLANDTDIDGGPKSVASVTQPANGTVVITGGGTGLTYAPNANYCNTPPGTTLETFTYTLTPGGSSTTVTVTVTCVDDNPTAVADAATVVEDSGANAIDVLANDTDSDGGPKSVASVTQPANGTVVVTGGGTGLTYAPNANYCNTPPGTTPDTFTYTLAPGGSSTTVSVSVTCVDDPPVAVADSATVNEDSGANAIPVLANDTDPDGGPISITSVTQPANGVVVITGGGTGLTYAPNANYCNNPPGTTPDTFTYTLTPGGSTTTVSVLVTCINDAPVLTNNPITYATAGNTQLHVAGATRPGVASISDPQSALAKSGPTDIDGPAAPSVVAASGASANGGSFTINSDGSFHYVPAAGFTGTDSFTYQVTDTVTPTTGTINITVSQRVWYIRDVIDANNAAGGDGRSTNAFDSIAAFNAATTFDGDIIFIFRGNTGTTPLAGGITLKNGQKLHGEGIGLTVPGFGTLVPAGAKPRINNGGGDAVSVPATAGNRQNVEIRGLDLQGSTNAVDVTASGANNVSITISDNDVRGAGLEGIDLNAGSTGTFAATLNNNSLAATGNAFDARTSAGSGTLTIDFSNQAVVSNATGVLIDGSVGGGTRIIGFANNAVSQDTGGTGISITSATFDATPGGSYQPVSGGSTVIGASGNGVGGSGIVFSNVAGDLSFTDLDIFADGGAGLRITGTGAVNTGAGTGTRVTVSTGVAIFEATGGPAVDVTNATVDLQLTSLRSTNSPTTGVSLTNVADGTATAIFSAGPSSSITNATGTDFNVDGGNATINYAGPINNTAGRSVSVTNRTGDAVTFFSTSTINDTGTGILVSANAVGAVTDFLGTLTLSTGTNAAFTATNGGTLRVMGATNTIVTTTGVALNVTSTTIGSGTGGSETGLRFRSISAGTAASGPANGIVLNNTGVLGSLNVTGTGGAASGGTIQRTTGDGVSLVSTLSPSFNNLTIKDTVGHGVKGSLVTNFTYTNGSIDNSGTGLGAESANIAFNTTAAGTENNLSGTVTITGNSLTNAYYHGIDIFNFNGTIADATISGNTITSTSSTVTSKGTGVRLVAFGSASTVANVTKATIANNVISNFPSANGILASGGNGNAAGPAGVFGTAGSATNVIAITGNRVAGFSAAVKMAAFAIGATVNGKGQGNFDISSNGTVANPITNVIGTAIANSSLGNANVTSNITNNVIVANNQAGAQGIGAGTSQTFGSADTPSLTVTIASNQISQTDGNGILVTARDATGTVRAKIQNNTVAAPLSGNRNGIRVDAGNAISINDTVCLNISGNTTAGVNLTPEGIGLRKQGTVAATNRFALHGFGTSPANQSQTAAYATSQNPGSASGTLIISGDNFNSPTCSFP